MHQHHIQILIEFEDFNQVSTREMPRHSMTVIYEESFFENILGPVLGTVAMLLVIQD